MGGARKAVGGCACGCPGVGQRRRVRPHSGERGQPAPRMWGRARLLFTRKTLQLDLIGCGLSRIPAGTPARVARANGLLEATATYLVAVRPLVRSTATTSATGARRRGTLFNGTRWSAYSSGQRCGAARPCITYRTASRSTSPPRPTPPRRTRRPAEQRPPRQTADEMIAKNKGTGEAVSDPEEDKQAANPPHHDR